MQLPCGSRCNPSLLYLLLLLLLLLGIQTSSSVQMHEIQKVQLAGTRSEKVQLNFIPRWIGMLKENKQPDGGK